MPRFSPNRLAIFTNAASRLLMSPPAAVSMSAIRSSRSRTSCAARTFSTPVADFAFARASARRWTSARLRHLPAAPLRRVHRGQVPVHDRRHRATLGQRTLVRGTERARRRRLSRLSYRFLGGFRRGFFRSLFRGGHPRSCSVDNNGRTTRYRPTSVLPQFRPVSYFGFYSSISACAVVPHRCNATHAPCTQSRSRSASAGRHR